MQEQEEKPRRSSFRLTLAVLLLITSGLILPLSSFGVAAIPAFSATGPRLGAAVVVPPDDQTHAKFVLDGVAPMFVVAPPSIEGSRQVDEFTTFAARPSANGPSTIIAGGKSGDIVANGSMHAQKLGFVFGSSAEQGQGLGSSAPGFSNGAQLRAGFTGEMMLVPTPPSTVSSITAAVPKVWWDFFQRRSKFEIYVEMLELMKQGPMTPFEVAFYARLNHKRTKEYAEFLAEAGYLQPVNEEGRALYALTKEGLGFLDRVQPLLVGPGIIEVASPSYQRDF